MNIIWLGLLSWYLSGMLGSFLFWKDIYKWSPLPFEEIRTCPSIQNLVIMFFSSFLGVLILFYGIINTLMIADVFKSIRPWWDVPVCDLWRKK